MLVGVEVIVLTEVEVIVLTEVEVIVLTEVEVVVLTEVDVVSYCIERTQKSGRVGIKGECGSAFGREMNCV